MNCSFSGCRNSAATMGLCKAHWRQQHEGKELRPLRGFGPNRAEHRGDYVQLHLCDKEGQEIDVALVSAEDYEKVRHLRWSRSGQGYAHAHARGRLVRLHQLVLETDQEVDHENGNRLDCQRWNLRETSRAQNGQNLGVRRDSESRSRNVRYRPDRGYYVVRVYKDGVCHWGGHHDTQEEAETAARELRDWLFTHNNEGRYA